MSEQFLAEAQILIVPDTAGFRVQLLKDLNNAKRGVKVEVQVVPDMTGFRAALIEAVKRSTTNVVARVRVVPDLTGFRAAVAAGAARSTRNLTTDVRAAATRSVGTVAVGPPTTTGRAATANAVKATAAEKALTDATNKAAFARQRLDGSLAREEKLVARLDREKLSLVAAEKAYTAALQEENAALSIQADRLRKTAAAQIQRTERQLAAPAQSAAAAQARQAEQAARAQARADAAQARLAARNAALAAKAQGPALAENAARDRLSKELAASEQARTRAVRQLAEAEQIEDNVGKKIIATRQALRTASTSVVAAEEGLAAAIATGNKELIERATLELNAARATKINAAANLEAAETEKLRLGRLGAARQGLIASIAQLTGLRGAALTANAAFIAAAAGVALFAKSVKSAADFASELKTFQVVAGATASEMDKVGDKAQALGRDITLPGVSASDAAVAMTELAKAGLSVQDSLDAARGVLQLATAAQIDNAQATNLTASALNAFGLAGDQAVHVADVLANSANDSQGSITDMGIALQQAAAVGRQAGLSLEQTTAALTILARAGLRGSDAGTSLRTALIRLINPTKKAQEQIEDLGLHLRTASGSINLNVFDEFAKKTRDMSKAQRDQALAVIFGQDAIRAAAILARTGAADLQAQIDSLNKTGTAADVAAARMTGLTGAGQNLLNQLQNLGLTVGSLATGPLTVLANAFADNIKFANDFIEILKKLPSEIPIPNIKIGPLDTDKQGKDLGQKIGGTVKAGLSVALKGGIANLLFPAVGLVPGGGPGLIFILNRLLPQKTLDEKARDVRKSVDEILATFRQLGNNQSGLNLNIALTGLDALADKLEKGDADSQKLAESVRQVRKQLENPKIIAGFKIAPIKLSPELLRGDAGRQAGEAALKGFEEGLPPNKLFGLGAFASQALADGIEAGKGNIGAAVNNVVSFFQDELQAAINKSAGLVTKRATGRQSGLEEAFNDILIGGGTPSQQIANLRKQAAQQQKIVDANTGATEAQIKARRAAKDKLSGLVGQIQTIQDQQVTDAKQAATDIQNKQAQADQALLDTFAPRRNAISQDDIRAQASDSLKDNIAVQVELANTISAEIASITKNVKNAKTARAEIASRVTELVQVGANLDDLRKQAAQREEDLATNRFETRLGLAQTAGAPQSVLLKIFDRRITELNKEIAAAKKEGRATADLRTALADVANQRRQTIDDFLAKQTELAKLTFGDTSNKSPIITALNKEIANKRKEIAQAKKAHKATIDLRIQLQQLINDRKEILNDAKSSSQDPTTAFDLLTEFNAKFNDIAGNAITPNQPFAGSSAFSTDIVNKGIAGFAQTGLPHRPIDIRLRGDDQQSKQLTATEELIAVIRENTEVIRGGGGNRSTVSVAVPGEIAGKNKLAAFWAARTARDVKDG